MSNDEKRELAKGIAGFIADIGCGLFLSAAGTMVINKCTNKKLLRILFTVGWNALVINVPGKAGKNARDFVGDVFNMHDYIKSEIEKRQKGEV